MCVRHPVFAILCSSSCVRHPDESRDLCPPAYRLRLVPLPRANRSHRYLAGIFTAAAVLRADSAMLVFASVTLAFLGTSRARDLTGFNCRAQDVFVRARSARGQGAGGFAQISTIQIETNALTQALDHRLRKTRICARDAGLCAGKALIDASHERRAEIALHIGMGRNHLLRIHRSPFVGCRVHMQRDVHATVPTSADDGLHA